jgi:hypothetical protein
LKIKFSDNSHLVVYKQTLVKMPHIGWEVGKVSDVQLQSGSIRWVCSRDCETQFSTDISKNTFSAGDYLLEYNPKIPLVSLSVLTGSAGFSGLDNELSASLQSGDKVSFKGLLENQEPAFDILLEGRKIAKGQLLPVEKIDLKNIERLEKVSQKKKAIQKIKPKAVRTGDIICLNPSGKFQQCLWACEGRGKHKTSECQLSETVKCIRKRCDANGQWSDPVSLPSAENKCRDKSFVDSCDY